MENKIEIFKTKDAQAEIQVQFDNETVWLNQNQMATLFQQTKQNISLHINNCYNDGELERMSTVKESLTTAKDGKNYKILYYNLDVIISVGYRVKSQRGTQFRQWATQRFKDYLVKGYAINQKRLDELSQMVTIIEQSNKTDTLQINEAKGLLNVLSHYTKSYVLLNQFDSNSLILSNLNENITYQQAKSSITKLTSPTHQLKRSY